MEKEKILLIPGTKLAVNNTQLLVSSGIPSFDELIGGGLPVGTVSLIEEDTCGTYSKVMIRYFLAEGVVNSHSLYIASQDCSPKTFVHNLPAVISDQIEKQSQVQLTDEKMTIAWRYQNMKLEEKSSTGHFYDLTKSMNEKMIDQTDITYWDGDVKFDPVTITFKNPAYHSLLQDIKDTIDKQKLQSTDTPKKRNVIRIALHSLGSPLWLPNGDYGCSSHHRDLDLFLYCLRAIARSAFAVVLVSVPSKIINKDSIERCIFSSDIVIRLDAFAGTELEKNKFLSDYNGFFKFVKYPIINTLKSNDPGPVDYAFKMRRKKFTIEVLHLPPDFSDSSENEKPSLGCGSSNKHLLEF